MRLRWASGRWMITEQYIWRKVDRANRMTEIVEGIEFKDGIKQLQAASIAGEQNPD